MPNVAVNQEDIPSINNTAQKILSQIYWGSWRQTNSLTWSKEEVVHPYINIMGVEQFQFEYLADTSAAELFGRPSNTSGVGFTGDFILDDVGLLSEYRDHINGIVTDCFTQIVMAGIAGKETGLEEQLLAEFREGLERLPTQISERLQGFIDSYENYGHSSERVLESTLAEVKELVAWLSQRDPKMFAKVTEDGMLALEARVALGAQLFIEIDRDGTIEATLATSRLGILGLNVASVSDLTYDLVVSLIGGS